PGVFAIRDPRRRGVRGNGRDPSTLEIPEPCDACTPASDAAVMGNHASWAVPRGELDGHSTGEAGSDQDVPSPELLVRVRDGVHRDHAHVLTCVDDVVPFKRHTRALSTLR